MGRIGIFQIFLMILLLGVSCDYTDPYEQFKGKDLITSLDLLTDWTPEAGVSIVASLDPPPSGETATYLLTMSNLLTNSDFEAGIASWSSIAGPTVFQWVNAAGMTGNGFMHLSLNTQSGKDAVYSTFNATAQPYRFKFNCKLLAGSDLKISAGPAGVEELHDDFTATLNVTRTAIFDIPAATASGAYEVRLGSVLADPLVNYNFEVYIDQAAVYLPNNNSIIKELSINGSGYEFDDGSGSTFEEGIYRLEIYAKADTSSKATIRLGTSRKEYSLTAAYQKIWVEAQILHEDNRMILEIVPTADNPNDRFPGSILITKPKLYFLPDQAIPKN